MTPHGSVKKTTVADVHELLKTIRKEDERELREVGNNTPKNDLMFALLAGEPCLALRTHQGDLLGILTVVPVGFRKGIIAMAGTVLLEKNSKAFLRGSLDVLKFLDSKYDLLYNVCDARNTVHHKWLKWLGFSFLRLIPEYGTSKVPVYEFARLQTNV